MITAAGIESAFVRASVFVALGLSAFVCLALLIRARWPTLVVRVATTVAILLALGASPGFVSIGAGPFQRIGWFVGTYVHPGWAILWGPSIIACVVGLVFALLVIRRGRRRATVA